MAPLPASLASSAIPPCWHRRMPGGVPAPALVPARAAARRGSGGSRLPATLPRRAPACNDGWRVLLGGQGDPGPLSRGGVPALGGGHAARAAGGPGHHREQPPLVLRSLLRAAAAAAEGHLPG